MVRKEGRTATGVLYKIYEKDEPSRWCNQSQYVASHSSSSTPCSPHDDIVVIERNGDSFYSFLFLYIKKRSSICPYGPICACKMSKREDENRREEGGGDSSTSPCVFLLFQALSSRFPLHHFVLCTAVEKRKKRSGKKQKTWSAGDICLPQEEHASSCHYHQYREANKKKSFYLLIMREAYRENVPLVLLSSSLVSIVEHFCASYKTFVSFIFLVLSALFFLLYTFSSSSSS